MTALTAWSVGDVALSIGRMLYINIETDMLTTHYLLQGAYDLFDPIAGLNDIGVMKSFQTGLERTRGQLLNIKKEVCPSRTHEEMCYHFHVGTSMLMALFDGMAVYIEKKVSSEPSTGVVYWQGEKTFIDPRFEALRIIKQRTCDYIIKGGITANSLRNFTKHYLPWLPLSDATSDGVWDLRFPIDSHNKSGPIHAGLLTPLFNDAVAAYVELGKLLNLAAVDIHNL